MPPPKRPLRLTLVCGVPYSLSIPAHRHVVGVEAVWGGDGPQMALALEAADMNMQQALQGRSHSTSNLFW